jgi:hypothetical protein
VPGVSIPIIDQLVHPSYGLVSAVAIVGGPFGPAASYTFVPPQNVLSALTYGFKVTIDTVAAHRGKRVGIVDVYEQRLFQVAVDYTYLDGGIRISEWHDYFTERDIFWWAEALPSHLYVYVDPAVTLNFFYLQT